MKPSQRAFMRVRRAAAWVQFVAADASFRPISAAFGEDFQRHHQQRRK
jgi:hypothetical protein